MCFSATPIPGVRIITLNRPEARNAINRAAFDELILAVQALDEHEAARVAILTGTGSAFCTGVDLKDASDPALLRRRRRERINPACELLKVAKPVIAAVNGPCVAGGLELALACDIIIASDRTTFADTLLQLGLIPSWGGAALLPLAVGLRRAKEMALTGRYATAVEAEHYGLVSEVVAPDALEARTLLVAERIAAGPTEKVAALLHIYDEGARVAHRVALERETLLRSTVDVSHVVRRDGV